jgi:hypothetical protein
VIGGAAVAGAPAASTATIATESAAAATAATVATQAGIAAGTRVGTATVGRFLAARVFLPAAAAALVYEGAKAGIGTWQGNLDEQEAKLSEASSGTGYDRFMTKRLYQNSSQCCSEPPHWL